MLFGVLAYSLTHKHQLVSEGEKVTALKLTSYDGKTWDTARFLGQTVVVNFWATWCPPCVKELPELSALAQKHKEVVFIGAVVHSPAEDVKNMVEKLGVHYLVAKVDSQEVERFKAESLPTTYVIDSNGKIVWAHAGPVNMDDLEEALER